MAAISGTKRSLDEIAPPVAKKPALQMLTCVRPHFHHLKTFAYLLEIEMVSDKAKAPDIQHLTELEFRIETDVKRIKESLDKALASAQSELKVGENPDFRAVHPLLTIDAGDLNGISQKVTFPFNINQTDRLRGCRADTVIHYETLLNGVGHATCCGVRCQQEDAVVSQEIVISFLGMNKNMRIQGIFDGHGGIGVADFLKEHCLEFFKERFTQCSEEILPHLNEQTDEEKFQVILWNTLKLFFVDINNSEKMRQVTQIAEGSTANISFLVDNNLYVASVGDSSCLLVTKEGQLLVLSDTAKPSKQKYVNRVIKRGGKIVTDLYNTQRCHSATCMGGLATAGALGDRYLLGIVSPRPTITHVEVKKGDLVLHVCDGALEKASLEQLGEMVKEARGELKYSTAQQAALVVNSAFLAGSRDNISCIAMPIV